jgi:putative transposase
LTLLGSSTSASTASAFSSQIPWELEAALRDFVAYYNNERHHEALDNVTPADAYFGRKHAVVSEREKTKKRIMRKRKKEYRAAIAA